MVNYSQSALDATFSALSDPTRRAILARLAKGEAPVMALAEPFDVSLPAISKHLRVLEPAGLLHQEKDGRVRRCRLVAGPMRTATEWLERYRQFWEYQFDALAGYLRQTQEEEKRWRKKRPGRGSRSSSAGGSRRPGRRSSGRGRTRRR